MTRDENAAYIAELKRRQKNSPAIDYVASAIAAGWEYNGKWMSPDDNNETCDTAKEACERFGIPLSYIGVK